MLAHREEPSVLLFELVARQVRCPRGHNRLVGDSTLQVVCRVECSRVRSIVVANRGGELGGRTLLVELEGLTVYGGDQHVLREGGSDVGKCGINLRSVDAGDGAYDRGCLGVGGRRTARVAAIAADVPEGLAR